MNTEIDGVLNNHPIMRLSMTKVIGIDCHKWWAVAIPLGLFLIFGHSWYMQEYINYENYLNSQSKGITQEQTIKSEHMDNYIFYGSEYFGIVMFSYCVLQTILNFRQDSKKQVSAEVGH